MSNSPRHHHGTALRLSAATAVVATAATGALVLPGGAAHASGAAVAGTSISIRAVHPRVHAGGQDAVTGDLQVAGAAPEAGRTVTLEAKAAGETAFTPVGTATTGVHGGLRLKVSPEVTTRYRWHYDGAADARARTSGTVGIRVTTSQHRPTRLPTSLSIRAVHRLVGTHGVDTIKGRLRSRHTGLPHRYVVLLARPSGTDGWRFVGAHRTQAKGLVAFGVHPNAATAYRLQFAGTTVFRPAHSGTAKVGVRPSVSISATPASVDPGDSTAISGVVTSKGSPVVGATVDLLARPAAKPHHAFTQVGSGTTAADGAVGVLATPAADTVYRWRLVHTTGVQASTSKDLLVRVRATSSLSVRGKATGAGYVVTGTLRSHGQALKNRVVALMAQAPGATTFSQVATARTGSQGGVKFTRASAPGTEYRLDYAGGANVAASSSGVVTS